MATDQAFQPEYEMHMIQPNQPQHYACYTCNSSMILYRTIQRRAGEHDIKLWTCTHCIAAADTQSSAPRYASSKAKCEIIETVNPSTGANALVMLECDPSASHTASCKYG